MTEKEQIKELKEKIQGLEKVLDNVLVQPKTLATISAGPFKDKDISYYRVSSGGSSMVVTYTGNVLFGNKKEEILPEGTEVLILNGVIIDVVPTTLHVKEKNKNTFKLINWNEVGGLKSQVEKIRKAIETPLKNAKLAAEYGLQPLKGILLYGPPGCGKTLVAKAIASTIITDSKGDDGSFVYIKGAELLTMWVGMTEQRIVQMFKGCREYAAKTGKRSVLFIDEAEAILPARGSRRSSDVDKTIVPTFLSEMDGFDDGSPIVILSTNLPNEIDSAILRAGRIDLKIEVGRPTKEDSEEIFGIHLNNIKLAEDKESIAKNGAGYLFNTSKVKNVSGALIQAAVKIATQKALDREITDPKTKHPGVTAKDVMDAILEVE